MELSELNHPRLFYEKVAAKVANFADVRFGNTLRRSTQLFSRRGPLVRTYWWTYARNFGDLITPFLLAQHGITPILCESTHATLAATGSILGMLPPGYSGCIFGSGLLSENHMIRFPQATVSGLRGDLSRRCVDVDPGTVLGDPGLLIADHLPRRSAKQYELGLVPHYEDKFDRRLLAIASRYPRDVRIINVQRSPSRVALDIDRCRHIVSSSLHGLVLADSLGIPNAWAELSDRLYGKGFKFRDYYSAFNVERTSVTLSGQEKLAELLAHTHAPPAAISQVTSRLREAWTRLCAKLLESNGNLAG